MHAPRGGSAIVSDPRDESLQGLWERFIETRDPGVRNALVEAYLPIVRPILSTQLRRYPGHEADLIQVGTIGLMLAVERYQPRKGRSFRAYASTLVSGEVLHYLRDRLHAVRMPRELADMRGAVQAATHRLEQAGNRVDTGSLSSETGFDEPRLEAFLQAERTRHAVSLDETIEEDGEGARPRYQLVDARYRSFEMAEEDRLMLAQAMVSLRVVSREVIDFAFYQDLSQTEIARRLGISQMQVSRRLRTALDELWKALNSRLW